REVLVSGEGVLEKRPVWKEHDDRSPAVGAHRGGEVGDDPPRQVDDALVSVEPPPTWRTRLPQRPDRAQDPRRPPRVDRVSPVPPGLVRGITARERGKLGVEIRPEIVVEALERLA